MAPLLYKHLRQCDADIPADIRLHSRRRVRDYRNDEGQAPFDGRREPFISEPRKSRAAAGAAR
jgi:hypothetical protein